MRLECTNAETNIEFRFAKDIVIPQSILRHFIDILDTPFPTTLYSPIEITQTTMIARIGFDQISTNVSYSKSFDLIFVEFYEAYSLALLQRNHILPLEIYPQLFHPSNIPCR